MVWQQELLLEVSSTCTRSPFSSSLFDASAPSMFPETASYLFLLSIEESFGKNCHRDKVLCQT